MLRSTWIIEKHMDLPGILQTEGYASFLVRPVALRRLVNTVSPLDTMMILNAIRWMAPVLKVS